VVDDVSLQAIERRHDVVHTEFVMVFPVDELVEEYGMAVESLPI